MPGLFALLASPFSRQSYIPEITVSTSETQFHARASHTRTEEVYPSIQAFVKARCPSLSQPYVPPWWLFSGHLQTLYSVLGDFSSVDQITYHRTYLQTPDGGTLGLDFTPNDSEGILPKDTPIVVVLHGLTGGSYESYVRSILTCACKPKALGGLGYRGVVVNFRGCADVPLTSERLYSAATTDDLAITLLYLSHRFPNAPLVGLGFSLGANVMTRYVAAEGDKCRLSSACVLGCPWDLAEVTRSLEKGFFSRHIYSKGMGKNVVGIIRRNLGNLQKIETKLITPFLPGLLGKKGLLLREVDEMAIRLIGGPSPPFPFPSAWDYYSWASNHRLVHQIRRPLMFVNAKDDPIVLGRPSIEQDKGYSVLVLTRGGGHLGWFDSGVGAAGGLARWVQKPVLEWLKATAEDLLQSVKQPQYKTEIASDFISEIGHPDIAYKVVNTGFVVDWHTQQSRRDLHAGL